MVYESFDVRLMCLSRSTCPASSGSSASSMSGATCPDAMDQLHVDVLVRNQDQRMVQTALVFIRTMFVSKHKLLVTVIEMKCMKKRKKTFEPRIRVRKLKECIQK